MLRTSTTKGIKVMTEVVWTPMQLAGARAANSTIDAALIIIETGVTTRDAPELAPAREAFYQGFIATRRKVALEEAMRRLGLGSAKNKNLNAEDKRDDLTEADYSLAKFYWSKACDDAELPKLHKGGNRAGKAGGKPAATAPTPEKTKLTDATGAIDDFVVPSHLPTPKALKLMSKFANAMTACVNGSAAELDGACGAILRKLASDAAQAIKKAQAALASDEAEDTDTPPTWKEIATAKDLAMEKARLELTAMKDAA